MKSNMFIADVDGLCYLLNPTEKTAKVTYKNVKKRYRNVDNSYTACIQCSKLSESACGLFSIRPR